MRTSEALAALASNKLRPRQKKRPKDLWIRLHLWLGLGGGLLFALLGVSGSLNIYADELDRWANSGLYAPEPSRSASLQPGPLIAAAGRQAPAGSELAYMEVLGASPATVIVAFRTAEGQMEEHYVERSTGRLLGHRRDGDSLADLLLALHDSLLIDAAAPRLAGVVGAGMLLSILSGIYIWWPGRRRVLESLKVRRSKSQRKFYYELHRTAGAVGAGLLLMSCVTGIYQAFPEPFVSAVGTGDEVLERGATIARRPINLPAAIRIAEAEFPGAILRRADLLPGDPTQFRVIVHDPRQPGWRGGESRLWIEAGTGTIVRRRDPDGQKIGPKILAWLPPLHTGEVVGEAGRFVMFVVGLVPALLLATGFRLWQIRRKARRGSTISSPI